MAGEGRKSSKFSVDRACRIYSQPFRILLLRRLRMPLPLTAHSCRCGRLLDSLGHRSVAGSWAGSVFHSRILQREFAELLVAGFEQTRWSEIWTSTPSTTSTLAGSKLSLTDSRSSEERREKTHFVRFSQFRLRPAGRSRIGRSRAVGRSSPPFSLNFCDDNSFLAPAILAQARFKVPLVVAERTGRGRVKGANPQGGAPQGGGPKSSRFFFPLPQQSPGFTRQPRNSKREHFRAAALQTPPKFHENTPKRRKNERKLWRERGKKRETLGLPPFGAPKMSSLLPSLLPEL